MNRDIVRIVQEAGGWSIFIPGLPLSADGATIDEAVVEMVDALREYAEDWHDRLAGAVNHRDNWPLVEFVRVSDDSQLSGWVRWPEGASG